MYSFVEGGISKTPQLWKIPPKERVSERKREKEIRIICTSIQAPRRNKKKTPQKRYRREALSHLDLTPVEAPVPDWWRLSGLSVRHSIRSEVLPVGDVRPSRRQTGLSFRPRSFSTPLLRTKPLCKVRAHLRLKFTVAAIGVSHHCHRSQGFSLRCKHTTSAGDGRRGDIGLQHDAVCSRTP